jgi:hypothetical protein
MRAAEDLPMQAANISTGGHVADAITHQQK